MLRSHQERLGSDQRVIAEGKYLVWYRRIGADESAFWEKHWEGSKPAARVSGPVRSWYRSLVEEFLPREGLILEAGCGPGGVLRSLAVNGYEMRGLDFCLNTLRRTVRVDLTNHYMCGDVRMLPCPDESLAGYVSFGVIEHFPDLEERVQILREAHRCLAADGVILISVPYYNPLRRIRAFLGGFRGESGALQFYQMAFRPEEFCKVLAQAGFEPLGVDAYDAYKGFKDTVGFGGLLRWIQRQGGVFHRAVDHPPRWLRRAMGHMLLVAARKV